MSDITNVKVGACDVSYNGVNLGHTIGGVEFTYEPEYKDVAVDKYGTTVVEKYLLGEKITVKVPLAESTIANMLVGMPMGTNGTTKLTLGSIAGKKATDEAKQLVLHPTAEAGRDFDIVIYKAFVAGTVVLSHTNDGEKIIEVEFSALLDETKADGNYLGLIGDSAT